MTRLFAGTPFDRPPRCEQCGALQAECTCPPEPPVRLALEKQTARLAIEKRKKGKIVTVVRGLAAADNDLQHLLRQLKSSCGAGGTVGDDTIEIQGDHVARLRELLREIGYKVKG